MKINFDFDIEIEPVDIDDIMCAALEGGITYWCDSAKPVGTHYAEYMSEQISGGGSLLLHDNEDDVWYELTLEKFLDGLKLFLIENGLHYVQDGILMVSDIDAADADCIIQYALFGEIIFG